MIQSKKKKKLNPMLINVLIISGAVHVLAILILGGITIVKYIIPDDAEFEEPPAIEEVEVPKEVKVEIKPPPPAPQKQASKLQMRPMANIAVSSVDVNLPSMDQSFTVSAGVGGLGRGLLGSSRGSMNIGISSVNIFGLKSKGEKILFIVDASRRMVYDEKGGLNSYKFIKDEIANMVGNLGAGTLFNVMLLDGVRYNLFKPQLVSAGTSTTTELMKWFVPVNSSITKVGLPYPAKRVEIKTELEDFPNIYAGLRTFFRRTAAITQMALEMNVDSIFQIMAEHPGYGKIETPLSPKQKAELEATQAAERERDNDPKIQAIIEARKQEELKMKQLIQQKLAALNKQRAAKGIPPKVLHSDLYVQAKDLGLTWKTPQPPRNTFPRNFVEGHEVERYFRALSERLFIDRNLPIPSINIILFLAEDEELPDVNEKEIKAFTRDFKGKMKVIRGLSGIQSSAGASTTTN